MFRAKANSSIENEAAKWVARRDRGLSPREQDEYFEWLRSDQRHAATVARAEATLRRVLRLSSWRPAHGTEPNPDLLARPRRVHRWLKPVGMLAAAAVFALGVYWRMPVRTPAGPVKSYLHVNERVVLPDGSLAELRDGTKIEACYAAAQRRVRLTGGEAQFSVMKDPTRPFVVEAGGVAVRALGTVFAVRLDAAAVEVLVTEGKVRVGAAAQEPGKIFRPHTRDHEPPTVAAGQRAVVSLATSARAPVVSDVSPGEIRRALAWQAPRLQFDETPLAEAVAEFNRRNRHQLVLGDPALGAVPIGGTFRPDNVEGFVRLLGITVGVRAESRGADETVLYRGK